MLQLTPAPAGRPLTVVCLGAHSDDIEIGAGGAVLSWIAERGADVTVHWRVLSAAGAREREARRSAEAFLEGASPDSTISLDAFKDGFFPAQWSDVKARLEEIRAEAEPDIVLTHWSGDAHQDHRIVAELAWNTFRDHLILEYEIPKWDGDMGRPNVFAPLSAEILARKIALLDAHFGSQRGKGWFDEDTFRGLARLRGVECRAPDGFAEGFYARKAIIAL